MSSNNLKYKGYVGKILRVNLTDGTTSEFPITNELAKNYIGGAGMAARILYDELEPGTDPLSPENKAILLTGPVEGTMIPTASRVGLYSKSPLTNSFFPSVVLSRTTS